MKGKNENGNNIFGVWMNMKTYLKNIDGIFDYSSSKNNCCNVFVMKKHFIVRTENNRIKYYKQQFEVPKDEKILFAINYNQVILKLKKQFLSQIWKKMKKKLIP